MGNDGAVSLTFQSETAATLVLPGGRFTQIQPFFASSTDTGKLDGTYRLVRASVDYLGGPLADTAVGNIVVTGTMVIAGNQATQTLIAAPAGSAPITITLSGTFVDYGAYRVFTQAALSNRLVVLARAPLLITEVLAPASGSAPVYAEVDQWTRDATVPAAKATPLADADATPPPGSGLAWALSQPHRSR